MKKRLPVFLIIFASLLACNLIETLLPDENFVEETPTERSPNSTAPCGAQDCTINSEDPSTKWGLWDGCTRLRGVDLHPCSDADHVTCSMPITQQDIVDLRALNANLINASYPGVFEVDAPFEVDPFALEHLDNLIAWAEEADIFVVIHFRTGPGRSESAIHLEPNAVYDVWTDPDAQDAFIEMWRFTAERYKDSPVVVGYDLMVEPLANLVVDPDFEMDSEEYKVAAAGTPMDWNALARKITNAIRSVDSGTPIIVSSLSWADPEWFDVLEPTGDPFTVYSFHAYEPGEYTHQEADKIEYSYPDVIRDSGESFEFNRETFEEYLSPVIDFAAKHDVPIYVGEFGAMRWVPNAEIFLRDEIEIFEQHGWNYAYYVWRGDEPDFDGFNLEYGADPDNHTSQPGNPLFSLFTAQWSLNLDFP
jgi:hypothetical protein